VRPFEHDGEEVGYVVEGELKLIVGGKTYIIAEGGSFFFRSDLPHSTAPAAGAAAV
jgi:quercetin dioxygenase-like cupin family protein